MVSIEYLDAVFDAIEKNNWQEIFNLAGHYLTMNGITSAEYEESTGNVIIGLATLHEEQGLTPEQSAEIIASGARLALSEITSRDVRH